MLKPVYKICPACLGTKEVEDYDPDRIKKARSEGRDTNVTCNVCEGEGVIPTGLFLIDRSVNPDFDVEKELDKLTDKEKHAILNLKR